MAATSSSGQPEDESRSSRSLRKRTNTVKKLCAFCGLGEDSQLGQGELKEYSPTPGSTALKNFLKRRTGGERLPVRRVGNVPENATGTVHDRFGNEVPLVPEIERCGFDSEEGAVLLVIDPAGKFWAHHCCAAWSEDVVMNDDYSLQNVDKAVVSALMQTCAYCNRLGASIRCKFNKCHQFYHYPCATAAGCYQNCACMSMWCTEHLDKVTESNGAPCDTCEKFGDFSRLLWCTVCNLHVHADCLDPPINLPESTDQTTSSSLIAHLRAGWQCPECKTCQVCQKPSDDAGMLCCDACDSGFHIYCLRPPMSVVPRAPWKCLNCRACSECKSHLPGTRPDARWRLHYTLCDDCFRRGSNSRKGADGMNCSVCQQPGRGKALHHCAHCQKIVHVDCDPLSMKTEATHSDSGPNSECQTDADGDYACPTCRPMIAESSAIEQLNEGTRANDRRPPSVSASASSVPTPTPPLIPNQPQPAQKKLPAAKKPAAKKVPLQGVSKKNSNNSKIQRSKSSSNQNSSKDRARAWQQQAIRRRRKERDAPHQSGSRFTETVNSAPGIEDKDERASTMIIVKRDCRYVLEQDICASCGSIGNGDCDALISCFQCGQAYHINCAGVRPNKVMLTKGWRCIECTVCEGCGQTADESRLLLCDDCDVSYHIYCMDPPLKEVPRGTWKCSWCASCHVCGTSTPGVNSLWQADYTRCGPCHSLVVCPACDRAYANEDVVLLCQTCDRWLHAACDGMRTEEEAELACSLDYTCLICRAAATSAQFSSLNQVVPSDQASFKPTQRAPGFLAQVFRAPDIVMDGVYLSETGLAQMRKIQSRITGVPGAGPTAPKRKVGRISNSEKEKMKLEQQQQKQQETTLSNPPSVAPATPAAQDSENVPTDTAQLSGGNALPGEGRGRVARRRVAFRVGFSGGFSVRSRPPRRTRLPGRACPDNPNQPNSGLDPASADHQTPVEVPGGEASKETSSSQPPPPPVTKRYIPPSRRHAASSYLLATYPTYLQEAFFGADQLATASNPGPPSEADSALESMVGGYGLSHLLIDNSEQYEIDYKPPTPAQTSPQKTAGLGSAQRAGSSQGVVPASDHHDAPLTPSKHGALPPFGSLDSGLDPDADPLLLFPPELFDDRTHKDLKALMGDINRGVVAPVAGGPSHLHNTNHPVSHVDDPSGIGDLLPIDPNEMHMYLEDGVTTTTTEHQHATTSHTSLTTTVTSTSVVASNQDQFAMYQGFHMEQSLHEQGPEMNPNWAIDMGDPEVGESGSHTKSGKQWSQRWEQDEHLGDMATISPVLYANLCHPELKQQYPLWVVRLKYIVKLWRALRPDEKQPYTQRASENRSAKKKSGGVIHMNAKTEPQMASQSQHMHMPHEMVQPPGFMPPQHFNTNGGSYANMMDTSGNYPPMGVDGNGSGPHSSMPIIDPYQHQHGPPVSHYGGMTMPPQEMQQQHSAMFHSAHPSSQPTTEGHYHQQQHMFQQQPQSQQLYQQSQAPQPMYPYGQQPHQQQIPPTPMQPVRSDVTSPHMYAPLSNQSSMVIPSSPMQPPVASPASSHQSYQTAAIIQRRDSNAGSGRSPRGDVTPHLSSPVHSPMPFCPVTTAGAGGVMIKQSPIKTPTTPMGLIPLDQSGPSQSASQPKQYLEAPPVLHPAAIAVQEAAERSSLLEQYREAFAQTQEVEQKMAKLKRQKKNLMAKQMRHKKSNQALEPADQQALEQVNNDIVNTQRELEVLRQNEKPLARKLEELGVPIKELTSQSGSNDDHDKSSSEQSHGAPMEQSGGAYWYGGDQQQQQQQQQQQPPPPPHFDPNQAQPYPPAPFQPTFQQQGPYPVQFQPQPPNSMPPPPPPNIPSPRFNHAPQQFPPQQPPFVPMHMPPQGYPMQGFSQPAFFPGPPGVVYSPTGQHIVPNPYMPYGAMGPPHVQQFPPNFRPFPPGHQGPFFPPQQGQEMQQPPSNLQPQVQSEFPQMQQLHSEQQQQFGGQSPLKPPQATTDFSQVPSPHKLNQSMQQAMNQPPGLMPAQSLDVSQPRRSVTEDSNSTDYTEDNLTEEQRMQLKMIESMPMTREVVNGGGDDKKKKRRQPAKKPKQGPSTSGYEMSSGVPMIHGPVLGPDGLPMQMPIPMQMTQMPMYPPQMQPPPPPPMMMHPGMMPHPHDPQQMAAFAMMPPQPWPPHHPPMMAPPPPHQPPPPQMPMSLPPMAPAPPKSKAVRKVKPEKAAALLDKLKNGPVAVQMIQPLYAAHLTKPQSKPVFPIVVENSNDPLYGDSQFLNMPDTYSSVVVPILARKMESSPVPGFANDTSAFGLRIPELPSAPYLGDRPVAYREYPPDTGPLDYVDTSSPETMDANELNPLRWMCSRPVDDGRPASPVIPTPLLSIVNYHPHSRQFELKSSIFGSKNGQPIGVSFTLQSSVSHDIGSMLTRLAKILDTRVPDSFEVEDYKSDQAVYKPSKLVAKEEPIVIAKLVEANSIPCIGCSQPVDSTVSTARRLTFTNSDGRKKTIAFCSQTCSQNYLNKSHGSKRPPSSQQAISNTGDESMTANQSLHDDTSQHPNEQSLVEHSNDESQIEKAANISSSGEHPADEELSPETRVALEMAEADARRSEANSRSKRYRPGMGGRGGISSSVGGHGGPSGTGTSSSLSLSLPLPQPRKKKWKGLRWSIWDTRFGHSVTKNKNDKNRLTPQLTDSEIKNLSMICRLTAARDESLPPQDTRACILCGQIGDGDPDVSSRLLAYDVNQWVHLNCALWSYDVYETVGGMLVNVQKAYLTGVHQKCINCDKFGATLACFRQRCNASYHLPCARKAGCAFFSDKTFYCPTHKGDMMGYVEAQSPAGHISPTGGSHSNQMPPPSPSSAWLELKSLAVNRRVYVGRDELSQIGQILFDEESRHTFRISAVIYHSIGGLAAVHIQSKNFNTAKHIYPVGYLATRFYWSSESIATRQAYLCAITEKACKPLFTVIPLDEAKILPVNDLIALVNNEDTEMVRYSATTPTEAWMPILQAISKLRVQTASIRLFPDFTSGEELFGLTDQMIVQLLESLPGAEYLPNYTFQFGRSLSIKHPLPANPSGASRCEPYFRAHSRRPHVTHAPTLAGVNGSNGVSSSGSQQQLIVPIGTSSFSSGSTKQLQQSRSSQYKKMKMDWRSNVYLAKSRIQGLGLYAAHDLERGTMVIEYLGDLIRNSLSDRREKMYESQNRGVYMFRLTPDLIVDATMSGGLARYINHSCQPNCAADIVQTEKGPKIVIITGRRILRGEELTYDYKFDFEDDHKIPCLCGAPNCKQWMN